MYLHRNGISLRSERYRLTRYFREQEPVIQLFDHDNDQDETINVAGKHPEILDKLLSLWANGNTGLFY